MTIYWDHKPYEFWSIIRLTGCPANLSKQEMIG